MDKLEIYDNGGLILDNVAAIGSLITSIDHDATETGRCPIVGHYCIAIFAMLDKITECVSIIQKETGIDK